MKNFDITNLYLWVQSNICYSFHPPYAQRTHYAQAEGARKKYGKFQRTLIFIPLQYFFFVSVGHNNNIHMTKRICSKNCCIISKLSSGHNLIAFHYVIFFYPTWLLRVRCFLHIVLNCMTSRTHGIILYASKFNCIRAHAFFHSLCLLSRMAKGNFEKLVFNGNTNFILHFVHRLLCILLHECFAYTHRARIFKARVPTFLLFFLHDNCINGRCIFVHLTLLLVFVFMYTSKRKTNYDHFHKLNKIDWAHFLQLSAGTTKILIRVRRTFSFRLSSLSSFEWNQVQIWEAEKGKDRKTHRKKQKKKFNRAFSHYENVKW